MTTELTHILKKDALTTYERLFEKHFDKEEIDEDPELYPEFRELCKNLRKPSIIERVKNRFS